MNKFKVSNNIRPSIDAILAAHLSKTPVVNNNKDRKSIFKDVVVESLLLTFKYQPDKIVNLVLEFPLLTFNTTLFAAFSAAWTKHIINPEQTNWLLLLLSIFSVEINSAAAGPHLFRYNYISQSEINDRFDFTQYALYGFSSKLPVFRASWLCPELMNKLRWLLFCRRKFLILFWNSFRILPTT